ncbi:bifunctional metallophosphatase/5'-nucleotidase [Paenibacillus yanchengensis]|uniref:Bifunctional metallophosphatase/5'-nucleotidase n=1 Tax=Paenibacillus yanchengensis TaxID=2035833 RepID=A0ABW4YN14_9BACL
MHQLAQQRDRAITIYHSNDIHSRLENAGKIATMIAHERRLIGSDRVLAVDCGDHMDRTRLETEGSMGEVNAALLYEADYDVITLGNNEGLTFTMDDLKTAYEHHAKFAVVCANLERSSDQQQPDWLQRNTIINKNGITIGITAVTAYFHQVYRLIGWHATEPIAAVQQQVAQMREQVDLVIVLSHLGLTMDYRLAEQVDGIDIIFGAHTHHLIEEPIIHHGAAICAAGKFGDHVGRVEVVFPAGSNQPIIRGECLPTAAIVEREEQTSIIYNYRNHAAVKLQRVITTLERPLPALLDRESELPNLLAIGLKNWMKADIGLVNNGQLLGGLASGDVTAGELHALCPSPINPCLMELTGRDVRLALEQSLQSEFIYKPIKGFGFRGERLGKLALAGLTVHYSLEENEVAIIHKVEVNGQLLRDDQMYRVGTIDMFCFKIGYESLASAKINQLFMPEFLRDIIETELANAVSLNQCQQKTWLLI